MKFLEQGTVNNTRYTVVPRTLSFVLFERELLLLRGAPDKRLWPKQLNGLGGHIEPGEDPYASALREIHEEAGLEPGPLVLRGLVHVTGHQGHAGVMLFVFVGQTKNQRLCSSSEGQLEWHALDDLPWEEMVADLPHLLPRLLHGRNQMIYGVYTTDDAGEMVYHFDEI